jgi:serine/threonine protein kinase
MSLLAGSRLGPYEILAPLGAGGMGEVYRARDTRLERAVAVKVLPGHLSSSAEVRRHSDAAKLPLDWSSDGRFLLFEAREPLGAKAKLWVLPLSQALPPPPDAFQRDSRSLFTRRALDCFRLGRVGTLRGVRADLPGLDRQVAGLDEWRHTAPLAARREGDLLSRVGQPAHGRGRVGRRFLRGGNPRGALRARRDSRGLAYATGTA